MHYTHNCGPAIVFRVSLFISVSSTTIHDVVHCCVKRYSFKADSYDGW